MVACRVSIPGPNFHITQSAKGIRPSGIMKEAVKNLDSGLPRIAGLFSLRLLSRRRMLYKRIN
jgi:hypothetical protein